MRLTSLLRRRSRAPLVRATLPNLCYGILHVLYAILVQNLLGRFFDAFTRRFDDRSRNPLFLLLHRWNRTRANLSRPLHHAHLFHRATLAPRLNIRAGFYPFVYCI